MCYNNLDFIKCSGNKNRLAEVLTADESFQRLGRNEIDVLNTCVGARLTMNKDEEVGDVCKAIEDMIKDAVEEAERKTEEAKKERIATIFSNIKNLTEKTGWPVEQSMDMLGIAESDRRQLLTMIN